MIAISKLKKLNFHEQGLLLLGLILLPILIYLSTWCWLLLGLIAGLQFKKSTESRSRLKEAVPVSKLLLFMLVVVTVAATNMQYGTLFGRDPGAHMLIIVYALKLLESKDRRDFMIFGVLSYVVLIVYFLFSQALLLLLYSLVIFVLVNYFLICFQDDYKKPLIGRKSLKTAGYLVLQSLPLAIFLFVIFPRGMNPLWSLPAPVKPSVLGLQDEMKAGDMSKMTQSGAVIFRARFKDKQPEPEQRYWRARVFENYQNGVWKKVYKNIDKQVSLKSKAKPIEYTLMLEPHLQNWVPLLDIPVPSSLKLMSNFTLETKETISKRKQFELSSVLDFRYNLKLSQQARKIYTYLPKVNNPRTQRLMKSYKLRYRTPEKIVEAVEKYFTIRPFEYTLKPEAVGKNDVDDFLFETRSGYCEHYSNALAYMLRLADIPTRIVIGYLGGEHNDVDDYFIIHDYDAHAWVEIWLEDKGWVRIDPTGWVAPERVRMNIQDFFKNMREANNEDFDAELEVTAELQGETAVKNRVRLIWDAVNHRWYEWVINYNRSKQSEALKSLGLEDVKWRHLGLLSIGLVIFSVSLLSYFLLRKKKKKVGSPLQRLYLRFCEQMSELGFERKTYEGPEDYLKSLERKAFWDLEEATRIISAYKTLYYGPGEVSKNALLRLKTRIKMFIKKNKQ